MYYLRENNNNSLVIFKRLVFYISMFSKCLPQNALLHVFSLMCQCKSTAFGGKLFVIFCAVKQKLVYCGIHHRLCALKITSPGSLGPRVPETQASDELNAAWMKMNGCVCVAIAFDLAASPVLFTVQAPHRSVLLSTLEASCG